MQGINGAAGNKGNKGMQGMKGTFKTISTLTRAMLKRFIIIVLYSCTNNFHFIHLKETLVRKVTLEIEVDRDPVEIR